jgi:hypothetical protein
MRPKPRHNTVFFHFAHSQVIAQEASYTRFEVFLIFSDDPSALTIDSGPKKTSLHSDVPLVAV